MKHDAKKLDSIIRRVIRESSRKYSKPLIEQGGLVLDPETQNNIIPKDTTIIPKDTKDKWGRPLGDKWYGFDKNKKIFISGPNKGMTGKEFLKRNTPKPEPTPKPTPTDDPKYVPYQRAKKMYDCKSYVSDSEAYYKNLIVGTKPQKGQGGVLTGGIPAIANEKEWDAVEKQLKRFTSNRGIVIYGESFIDQSSTEIWRPIFEWMGKNLGGDRLKEELEWIGWENSSYKTIADKYKLINPIDDTVPITPARLRRQADAEAHKQRSGFISGMPMGIKITLVLLIMAGAPTIFWRMFRKEGWPAISRFWGNKIRPITEEEIIALKEYIEKEYKNKKISDDDMIIWRKFFRQKKWHQLGHKREELADIMRRVEQGPTMPLNWAPRKWNGISMQTYIDHYLVKVLKDNDAFTSKLLQYERDVLVPMREKEYGIKGTAVPKKKKIVSPPVTKLTKFKKPPEAVETKDDLYTTIEIQNPEAFSNSDLKKLFNEFKYKNPETIARSGESHQAWDTMKREYKNGNVKLLNTHLDAGKAPSIQNWQADMKRAFPQINPSEFNAAAYKRYNMYMKIYKLMKSS